MIEIFIQSALEGVEQKNQAKGERRKAKKERRKAKEKAAAAAAMKAMSGGNEEKPIKLTITTCFENFAKDDHVNRLIQKVFETRLKDPESTENLFSGRVIAILKEIHANF